MLVWHYGKLKYPRISKFLMFYLLLGELKWFGQFKPMILLFLIGRSFDAIFEPHNT